MIRGYYKSSYAVDIGPDKYTHKLLERKIKEYCLPAAGDFEIVPMPIVNYPAAPVGAAMIFIDETYLNKMPNRKYRTITLR